MRLRHRVALVVAGVGLFVGTTYATATSERVVGRVVRQLLPEALRAPCTFDSARFDFLEGVEVRGLRVLDPRDPLAPPVIEVERVRIDYSLDVFGAGPHVTQIDVIRPRIRLARDAEGNFPLATLFDVDLEEDETPAPRPVVRVREGVAVLEDPTLFAGPPPTVSAIAIDVVPPTRWARDWTGTVVELSASSDLIGPIAGRAVLDAEGTGGESTLELEAVTLPPELSGRFAGEVQAAVAQIRPGGSLALRVTSRGSARGELAHVIEVEPRDVSVSVVLPDPHHGPPDPIEIAGINGLLRLEGDRLAVTGLRARVFEGTVDVNGTVEGLSPAGGEPRLDLRAHAEDLHVGDDTRPRMPGAARKVLEAFALRATISGDVVLTGTTDHVQVQAAATVRDGRVRFEGYARADGQRHGFPYEATDVNAQVGADGRIVTVVAEGRHGAALVRAFGTIDHPPGDTSVPDMTIEGEDVPLDDELRAALGERAERLFDPWGPGGVAKRIAVRISRIPGIDIRDVAEVELDFDGRAAFRPDVFPAALTSVRGTVRVLEDVEAGHRVPVVRLEEVRADGEGFTVRADGEFRGSGEHPSESLVFESEVQEAAGAFRRAIAESSRIPEGVKETVRKLGTAGPLHAEVRLSGSAGERRDLVTVDLRGASVSGYDDVLLPARDLRGRVVVDGRDLRVESVTGELLLDPFVAPLRADGVARNVAGTPALDLHIQAEELPLGDPLRDALGPLAVPAHRFWEDVHPVGDARADLDLRLRPQGGSEPPFEMTLTRIRGPLLPQGLELDNEDGTFHYDGRTATLALESAIGDAQLHIGQAVYDVATGRVRVDARLRNLRFPEDLLGPLSRETVDAIAEAAPGRNVHAPDLHVTYEPDPATLLVAGSLAFRPRTRRPLRDPGLAPEGAVTLDRLVFWFPAGGEPQFQGEIEADGFSFDPGFAVDDLTGAIAISGRIEDGKPRLSLRTSDADFRVVDLPVEDAVLDMTVGQHLRLDARARFLGGALTGRVFEGGSKVAYRGQFRLEDGEVAQLVGSAFTAEGPGASGLIDARLEFENPSGAADDLRGRARVEVTEGELLQVPVFGALFRVMNLPTVLVATFESGRLDADIVGRWVEIRELELDSPWVALSSDEGRVGLDGRIDAVVHARVRWRLGIPLIDPLILDNPLLRVMQERLGRARLGGTLRNPDVTWEPIIPGAAASTRREPAPIEGLTPPELDPW